jgi:DNA-binding PadR family transcriptional regulator
LSRSPDKFWKEKVVKTGLDLIILRLLIEKPKWGYEINMDIRDRFDVYLSAGTLYPLLHLLEERALVEGVWESEKGRGRRIYRITDQGREFLFAGQRALEDLVKKIRAEAKQT